MVASMGMGLVAVFAVSGSVVLLARQVHKRLLSDFMHKIECELGQKSGGSEKRVRFAVAAEVMEEEPSLNNRKCRMKKQSCKAAKRGDVEEKLMEMDVEEIPLNRQMLYRGIIEYKSVITLNTL